MLGLMIVQDKGLTSLKREWVPSVVQGLVLEADGTTPANKGWEVGIISKMVVLRLCGHKGSWDRVGWGGSSRKWLGQGEGMQELTGKQTLKG